MLSVLHVGKFYPPVPGGMERVVKMLCSVAPDRLDSRVLAFHTGRSTVEEVVEGVPVTRVGTAGTAGSVPVAFGFAARLRRARADVMIVHEPNPWALVSILAARPRIPLIIWFHSDVLRPRLQYRLFYEPIASPVYRRARRFVVSSPVLAGRSAALRTYQDRISVIPFGIDPETWRPTPAIASRAVQLRGEAGRPIVLFLGRLVPYKGVDVLIKAAASLPVRLIIAGEGPMRGTWERLAAEECGAACIEFVGSIADDEVKARMHAAAALVLPSVTAAEAFGVVQLEAMACGIPIISTNVPSGVPWVNQDGVTGLVVPPGDVLALRRALARLLDEPALGARLGAAGRARAVSQFSMAAMRDRFVHLCGAVAAGEP